MATPPRGISPRAAMPMQAPPLFLTYAFESIAGNSWCFYLRKCDICIQWCWHLTPSLSPILLICLAASLIVERVQGDPYCNQTLSFLDWVSGLHPNFRVWRNGKPQTADSPFHIPMWAKHKRPISHKMNYCCCFKCNHSREQPSFGMQSSRRTPSSIGTLWAWVPLTVL